jgi:transposase
MPVTATQKARKLIRQRRVLELLAEGKSLAQISEELNVSVRYLKKYRTEALNTLSSFPSTLSTEEVLELRQLEAELLSRLWSSGVSGIDTIENRIGSDREKSLDGSALARLLDSMTRISERKARLLGLDVPTKIVTQQLSYSYQKTDSRVLVSFDRTAIEQTAKEPSPGLSVTVAPELLNLINGHNTESPVQPADALPVASQVSRAGQAA